jgi:hypothetical protein
LNKEHPVLCIGMLTRQRTGRTIQRIKPAPIFASRPAFFTKIDIGEESVKEKHLNDERFILGDSCPELVVQENSETDGDKEH